MEGRFRRGQALPSAKIPHISPDVRDRRVALARVLERPRYEVLPLDETEDAVLAHVPPDVTVTVTASPNRGLGPTLGVAERLIAHGYVAVPHISARLVRDRAHLREILARVDAAGVRRIFVPAGDAPVTGEFAGTAELLAAMGDERARFDEIGITGYPESHPLISDDQTIQAMFDKAPMATCIVSQMCFDAATIATWVARVRARGTHLPIWIGVPGRVDRAKLIRISMRIGLAQSARFARTHRAWLSRLLGRQFRPDGLLEQLAPSFADADANLAGIHVFTFNDVARTERWRRDSLARLATEPA
jgi:methylenetetrahydrofolate reductase (NADPH)